MITNRATLISIGGTGDDENNIRTYSGQKVHCFGAIGHRYRNYREVSHCQVRILHSARVQDDQSVRR